MTDLDSALDFYETEKESESGGLHRLVKPMSFLHYLHLPLKSIHKYAANMGYKGTYSSFTSWIRRNVDFEAECLKHEKEFKALDPRPPLTYLGKETPGTTTGGNSAITPDVFAGRTPSPKKSPAATNETEPSVSESTESADKKLSAREALEKWQSPSYEDQLKKLGLDKGNSR